MNASVVLALFQKFHRELCLVLLVLLGLACGQLAATLAGMVLRPDLSQKPPVAASGNTRTQVLVRDLDQILQQNLFDPSARGRNAAAFKTSPAEKTEAKPVRKDLTLVGTLVSGAESTALIEVGKEITLFHLDDPFPGGGRIELIQRNRVVIRNQDESTTELAIQEEGVTQYSANANQSAATGVRSVGDNRWQVSRATAEAARVNIAEEMRLAQMEPRIINGQTAGFLVSKLNPRSILSQMGVRRGDVILKVNSMPIDSPEKALQILQQLREARQLTVDLERQDEPMTFAYEIN